MNSRTPSFISLLIVTAILILASQSARTQNRGPSTAEERTKAARLARELETSPLGKDAKEARQWFTLWLIQIPDISVKYCTSLLGPEIDPQKNYGTEVRIQMMFSQAAYMIENPIKAKDNLAVYTAGVQGSLNVYQGILKEKPEVKSSFLDDLVARRDRGELRAYVEQAMKKCK